MSITDAALKALIVSEVGDVDGILAANIDLIWTKYQQYRAVPDLQFLQAKRDATEMAITALRASSTKKTVGDLTIDKSGQVQALQGVLTEVCAQIAERMKQWAASKAPVVGQLATTGITPPPAFQSPSPFGNAIDANDSVYRGDAYRRTGTRGW